MAKLICLLILNFACPSSCPPPYIRHLLIITFISRRGSNWDLSLGYAGVFNFGHIASAVASYVSAILSKTFGINALGRRSHCGLIGVVAALIISLPVLRLKGISVCC